MREEVQEWEPNAEHVRDPLYGVSEILVYGDSSPHSYRVLGKGKDEAAAWKDAARRMSLVC